MIVGLHTVQVIHVLKNNLSMLSRITSCLFAELPVVVDFADLHNADDIEDLANLADFADLAGLLTPAHLENLLNSTTCI